VRAAIIPIIYIGELTRSINGSETENVLKMERVIVHGEADAVDIIADEEVEVGRDVPLVRPDEVPPASGGGEAAQHLLLVDAALQLERRQARQQRALLQVVVGLLLVLVIGRGSAGRGGAAVVGREADEAGAGGEGAGVGAGGRVLAGVYADVGDPVGVRRVVAELHLPLRRAVLVVLVRAPEVGPAYHNAHHHQYYC
jgi:hypothetical protein